MCRGRKNKKFVVKSIRIDQKDRNFAYVTWKVDGSETREPVKQVWHLNVFKEALEKESDLNRCRQLFLTKNDGIQMLYFASIVFRSLSKKKL